MLITGRANVMKHYKNAFALDKTLKEANEAIERLK